jgi:hypothetical protein
VSDDYLELIRQIRDVLTRFLESQEPKLTITPRSVEPGETDSEGLFFTLMEEHGRPINCFLNYRTGTNGAITREDVLNTAYPARMPRFGKVSFTWTMNALEGSGLSLREIQASDLYRTAPGDWKKAWHMFRENRLKHSHIADKAS